MAHPGAGAHHLHVAGRRAALIAHRILMADRAGADVGDDLHVRMGVRRKAGAGGDLVVVPHPDRAPAHPDGIMIAGEGEMVAGLQPAMVGMAERVEGSNVDHVYLLWEARRWRAGGPRTVAGVGKEATGIANQAAKASSLSA